MEYYFESYACPVTDPETCGFSYTVLSWYETDDKCNEIRHYVYRFGASDREDEGLCVYEYNQATGSKRHTNKEEKIPNETGYTKTEKCSVCGTLSYTETIDNYKYERTNYNYSSNGSLSGKTVETGLVFYRDGWWRGYCPVELTYRHESYNKNGEISYWDESHYSYPYAQDGNYCYREVTRFDEEHPKGYVIQAGTDHVEGMYFVNDYGCVPGTEYKLQCYWCGEVETRTDGSGGHRYNYDKESGLYVCYVCGLESETGKNGDVIFADYTLTEGNGEAKYIVGYRNHFGDDYTWRVSLIIELEGEDDYDQVILPDIQPEEVGDYRLVLDAEAIAKAAKEYADDCEYMVRITFVPTGKESMLDFAITLDPHILVLNEEKSTFVDNECTEIGTLVYDCMLCGAVAVEEKTYGGSHDTECLTVHDHEFDEENHQIYTETRTDTCKSCDYFYKYTYVYTYAMDGTIIGRQTTREDNSGMLSESSTVYDYEKGIYTETTARVGKGTYSYTYTLDTHLQLSYVRKDEEGNVTTRNTFEYIQAPDGNYHTTLEKHEQPSDDSWQQYEYEYDFEKDIVTTTVTGSDTEYRTVTVSVISSGNILSQTTYDAEDNIVEKYTYDYAQDKNGNEYRTLLKYEGQNGYWYQREYTCNFDKNERTETYTQSDSQQKTVTVSMLDRGNILSQTTYDADGNIVEKYTYEYVQDSDGNDYCSLEKHERISDGYSEQREYTYDFDKNQRTETYTQSTSETKVVTVSMINPQNTLSETVYEGDTVVQKATYEYVQDSKGTYYRVLYRVDRASDQYWFQYEYTYDFDNRIRKTTYTDSTGANKVTEKGF